MKIQLAQVDPLGEALHFLRMTGVRSAIGTRFSGMAEAARRRQSLAEPFASITPWLSDSLPCCRA